MRDSIVSIPDRFSIYHTQVMIHVQIKNKYLDLTQIYYNLRSLLRMAIFWAVQARLKSFKVLTGRV